MTRTLDRKRERELSKETLEIRQQSPVKEFFAEGPHLHVDVPECKALSMANAYKVDLT